MPRAKTRRPGAPPGVSTSPTRARRIAAGPGSRGSAPSRELLGEALATVLREPVRLSVAGRTDAGVHAWAQVASFVCAAPRPAPGPAAPLAQRAAAAGHRRDAPSRRRRRASSRGEAASRTYRYRLWLSPVKPVRDRAYVWNVRGAVDAGLSREAAAACCRAGATSRR